MENSQSHVPLSPSHSLSMQNTIPEKMFAASCISSSVGIILTAITDYYWLMGAFIIALGCCLAGHFLQLHQKISTETACLLPMLPLCFILTPLSWFTFDGLLGGTLSLSILFTAIIMLTYYRTIQYRLVFSYLLFMCGLIIHWLITQSQGTDVQLIASILIAYITTISLLIVILENVKQKSEEIHQQMTDLSLRDSLTGLFNRRAVDVVIQQRETLFAHTGHDYAIVMMDVNRFKHINDDYGHHLGDSVLKTLAQCLQQTIRSSDYAFRFGGDEFLLILTHVDAALASQIGQRIRRALSNVQGYTFAITVSIGCAMRSEQPTGEASLELADRRMYEEKKTAIEAELALE